MIRSLKSKKDKRTNCKKERKKKHTKSKNKNKNKKQKKQKDKKRENKKSNNGKPNKQPWVKSGAPEMVSSSCSTSDTRHVTLVKKIRYENVCAQLLL
jgi:hypothetical protein